MPLRILRKKLLPARKAWKAFTTMLRAKLYRFQKSKQHNNYRPQQQLHAIRKQALKASSSHRLAPHRRSHLAKPSHHRPYKCHVLHKKSKPVFIDDLFIEHKAPEFGRGSLEPLAMHKGYETGGTSGDGGEKASGKTDAGADDMWESLVLTSPQMFGIDERAEEFIAKFRAELKTQERSTRSVQQ